VDLDGSNSSDPDADPLDFDWSFLSVPSTSGLTDTDITDWDTEFPFFTPDVDGTYRIRVSVDDGTTVNRDSIDVVVSTGNSAPVADAGGNQTGAIGTTVNLDGTGSFDADGDPISYQWTLVGPYDSSATLSSTNSVFNGFVPDVSGTYLAIFRVSDSAESHIDIAQITVP
jgi:hypothetical protein